MRIKERKEYENSTNRTVYNRLRKKYLAEKAEIRCSYCGWNSNENSSDKWYGTRNSWNEKEPEYKRYPSWKLATKNRKQWQEKPKSYKIIEDDSTHRRYYYCEITF